MAIDLISYIISSGSSFPVTTVTIIGALFFTLWMSLNSLNYFTSRSYTLPLLRYENSALAKYVIKKCPKLSEHYIISGIWVSGHLQSILSQITIFKEKELFRRMYIQMRDRGCIALDFYAAGTYPKTCPILLIIPTILGDSSSTLGLCRKARKRGFRPIIFNRRGQSNTYLTTPYFQVLGDYTDMRQIVNFLNVRYPYSPITSASLGLGSSLLLAYLGQYGSSSRVQVACCISPIFDSKAMYGDGMTQPYKWLLNQRLKSTLFTHSNCFSEETIQTVLNTDNLLEFDRIVSGKKQTIEEYRELMDPMKDVDDISCPIIFINSADDPISDSAKIPDELFTSTPHFFSCLTESGGHCGFNFTRGETESEIECSWAEEVSIDYLSTVLRFLRIEESKSIRKRTF